MQPRPGGQELYCCRRRRRLRGADGIARGAAPAVGRGYRADGAKLPTSRPRDGSYTRRALPGGRASAPGAACGCAGDPEREASTGRARSARRAGLRERHGGRGRHGLQGRRYGGARQAQRRRGERLHLRHRRRCARKSTGWCCGRCLCPRQLRLRLRLRTAHARSPDRGRELDGRRLAARRGGGEDRSEAQARYVARRQPRGRRARFRALRALVVRQQRPQLYRGARRLRPRADGGGQRLRGRSPEAMPRRIGRALRLSRPLVA